MKNVKVIILSVIFACSLMGCNTWRRMCGDKEHNNSVPPQADVTTINGTTVYDFDFVMLTAYEVGSLAVFVNDVQLNKYEYHYDATKRELVFQHQVILLPDGKITWKIPTPPAAPKGSHYKLIIYKGIASKELY